MTATCTAFAGDRKIASGAPRDVVAAVKAAAEADERVLIFDDADGRPVEFDLRGDLDAVLARLPAEQGEEKRGRGRPRLGVTAREVTLLPRHWDWLAGQSGGASVALRKLVEAALRDAEGPDRTRRAKEASYRFMTAVAGDLAGYEDAVRALFAADQSGLLAATASWSGDVREMALRLASHA